MADTPYQSLYRRYRPQRFAEVRGQDHVVTALRNAVRTERVAHAYLFSGPRGTGKTSTARILAKALNCTDLQDGEPDGVCESCVQVQRGASLDVQELDAASNNGVEAMRDLVSRAALTSPGRWKVYIVDEVHMLSTAASNALLKTLEEPPAHVVFVLATTDPQKVLPTIRSRVQHFEFRLLPAPLLADLVTAVRDDAGLDVTSEAIDLVVRRGNGSARDALSALDMVAAAGVADDETPVVDDLVEALCDRDVGRALVAVAEATGAGRDARRLGTELIEHLRHAFLAVQAPSLVPLPDEARERVENQARRLGTAGIIRALEAVGEALIEMREALDPRITLEVAIVRVAKPEADATAAALLERVERLERGLSGHLVAPDRTAAREAAHDLNGQGAPTSEPVDRGRADGPGGAGSGGAGPAEADPAKADPAVTPTDPGRDEVIVTPGPGRAAGLAGPAAEARATLGAVRRANAPRRTDGPAGPASDPPGPASSGPASSGPAPSGPAPSGPAPSGPAAASRPAAAPPVPAAPASDGAGPPAAGQAEVMPQQAPPGDAELASAWTARVLPGLQPKARARYQGGRLVGVQEGRVVFSLPNEFHRKRCEECRPEVEAALGAHFGRKVPMTLVVDSGPATAEPSPADADGADEEVFDASDLVDAPSLTVEDRLKRAFPGALEVEG